MYLRQHLLATNCALLYARQKHPMSSWRTAWLLSSLEGGYIIVVMTQLTPLHSFTLSWVIPFSLEPIEEKFSGVRTTQRLVTMLSSPAVFFCCHSEAFCCDTSEPQRTWSTTSPSRSGRNCSKFANSPEMTLFMSHHDPRQLWLTLPHLKRIFNRTFDFHTVMNVLWSRCLLRGPVACLLDCERTLDL